MPEPLTPIERKIYQFIVDHLKQETYQPSIREIGQKFGIRSTKTVSEHLQAIARKGHIAREASRSRGVKILGLNLSTETYSVRVYGAVRDSNPMLDERDVEGTVELDRALAGSPDSFFLRVRSGVVDAPGVSEGDHLLIEPTESFEDHDWVAVQQGGTVRVVRWRAGSGAELEGAGEGKSPICVLGRVRVVVRRLRAGP
ncbi:MAG: hypothetical protein HY702_05090 [Gemmatimonadetes bacterium]|nr:hypothetical protein [Gemmatimonadota bacterium]